MTAEEKGKRLAELTKKQAAGTITPEELKELKALLSGAPELQPGYTPVPTQADFDAARKAAADAETERQRAAAAEAAKKVGAPGAVVEAAKAAVPDVKPEDMKVNPDLIIPAASTPAAEPSAKPVVAKKAETPSATPASETAATPTDEFAAARAAGEGEEYVSEKKPAEEKKEPTFGEKLRKLAVDYGVPILDLLQGAASGYTGSTKETALDKRLAEQAKQKERDFMAHLQELQDQKDEERLARQREFEAQQNELNRLAEKEAAGQELSMREKIARMQLAASRASAPASVIPQ